MRLREGQRLEAENRLLRTEGRPTLIAESPAMRPVLDLLARVGPSGANVLITGEHGTGKEVVARSSARPLGSRLAAHGHGECRRAFRRRF